MEGKIRIRSHYFEDGNVALKDIIHISDPMTFKGEDQDLESK